MRPSFSIQPQFFRFHCNFSKLLHKNLLPAYSQLRPHKSFDTTVWIIFVPGRHFSNGFDQGNFSFDVFGASGRIHAGSPSPGLGRLLVLRHHVHIHSGSFPVYLRLQRVVTTLHQLCFPAVLSVHAGVINVVSVLRPGELPSLLSVV